MKVLVAGAGPTGLTAGPDDGSDAVLPGAECREGLVMIVYEVTAEVDESILDAFERYMVEQHVPDLLATGCFTGARVCRGAVNQLRMSYEAPDEATLQRYLEDHAPSLRADVMARFPSGISLSRSTLTVVKDWLSG